MVKGMLSFSFCAKNALLLIAAAVLLSCGIFSPRESDPPPPVVPGRSDPLSFSAIMSGTDYQFAKLQYEDLFSEALVYYDINSGSFNRTLVIQQLQLIQRQDTAIVIQWTTGTINHRPNDSIYLNGLKYKIFINGDITGVPEDSGSSDFVVVRENSDWHICLWRDYPAGQGRSFFSPP